MGDVIKQTDSNTSPARDKTHKLLFVKGLLRKPTPPTEMSIETGIVIFGVGVALYFALHFEPNVLVLSIIAVVSLFMAVFAFQRSHKISLPLIVLACLALGAWRASTHAHAVNNPSLPETEYGYQLSGWVEAIEQSGSGHRLRIRVNEMSRFEDILDETRRPLRVTVFHRKALDFKAGQGVSLIARLKAPPEPIFANGYDPAMRAYFRQIGGNGFAVSDIDVYESKELGFWQGAKRWRASFRHGIVERIYSSSPEGTAGLQVALLTGERYLIPEQQVESLRIAGLAHILAISGLHVGLVAGGIYASLCFLLASWESLAARRDIRKIAAALSLIAATGYLWLSTGAVSTQRAYIMAVIVFLAIILGRPALSIRSVSLAALVTLWLHPESLLSAGFQMSFAAATALIVVYGAWQVRRQPQGRKGPIRKFGDGMVGLAVTSAVAGGATAGYAALNFHHIAKYGLAGNLLAMPFFTFIVMPAGVVSLLALPFGLEELPLYIMAQGLKLMLAISDRIMGYEGSWIAVKGAPVGSLVLYSLGFIIICLAKSWRKMIGIAPMISILPLWVSYQQPDIRISRDGRMAYWDSADDTQALIVDRKRGDSYGRDRFVERAGIDDWQVFSFKQSEVPCDPYGCRIDVNGVVISKAEIVDSLKEDCMTSDIVVFPQREAGPVLKRHCQALLIDEEYLRTNGAVDITVRENRLNESAEYTLKVANPDYRRRRIWARAR